LVEKKGAAHDVNGPPGAKKKGPPPQKKTGGEKNGGGMADLSGGGAGRLFPKAVGTCPDFGAGHPGWSEGRPCGGALVDKPFYHGTGGP